MAGYTTILFDFGGVLATEGFREGLRAIGRSFGLDPEEVYQCGKELVYVTGYVIGSAEENQFWDAFRHRTGISQSDDKLRQEILAQLILRPDMVAAVTRLRDRGYRLVIVSDQTNWLDELNEKFHFSQHFERIFNSYHLGLSKKDPQLFDEVIAALHIAPHQAIFLDDDQGNLNRAQKLGIRGILVESPEMALRDLDRILGEDDPLAPVSSASLRTKGPSP
jgi:putative hydrolase of the HAD superfamily